MSKIKECVMLLLSVNTDHELREMLKEDGWSEAVRNCIREELNRRGERIR